MQAQRGRRTEMARQGSRRGPNWLLSRRNEPAESLKAGGSTPEDASHTQTTTSSAASGVEGFEMPNWEQPSSTLDPPLPSAPASPVKSKSPVKRTPQKTTIGTSINHNNTSKNKDRPLPVTPQLDEAPVPAAADDAGVNILEETAAQQHQLRRGSITNMVVTLDDSQTSFADDITFLGEESLAGNGGAAFDDAVSRPGAHAVRSTRPNSGSAAGMTAEQVKDQIKEEEMMRIAMERSLREDRGQPLPPQPSDQSSVGGSASAGGEKFVWKKGAGGRFRKVPVMDQVNEGDELGGASQHEQQMDRMEQAMMREALERSRMEGQRRHGDLTPAEVEQEKALLEMALQRSVQESGLPHPPPRQRSESYGHHHHHPEDYRSDRHQRHRSEPNMEPYREHPHHPQYEDPHHRGPPPRDGYEDGYYNRRDEGYAEDRHRYHEQPPRDYQYEEQRRYEQQQDPRYYEDHRGGPPRYADEDRHRYNDHHHHHYQEPRHQDDRYERGYGEQPRYPEDYDRSRYEDRPRHHEEDYGRHEDPRYHQDRGGNRYDEHHHRPPPRFEQEHHHYDNAPPPPPRDHHHRYPDDRSTYNDSLQGGASRHSNMSYRTTASNGTRAGFLHQAPPQEIGNRNSSNKDFEWRRGPGGRFIKVPIGGGGGESEQERAARVEREMIEEAMRLSMQDQQS